MDFIGRFENLSGDFAVICERLGIAPPSLPHEKRNTTGRKRYTEYYTPALRDLVAEKFRVDIEAFGYEFGDEKPRSRGDSFDPGSLGGGRSVLVLVPHEGGDDLLLDVRGQGSSWL